MGEIFAAVRHLDERVQQSRQVCRILNGRGVTGPATAAGGSKGASSDGGAGNATAAAVSQTQTAGVPSGAGPQDSTSTTAAAAGKRTGGTVAFSGVNHLGAVASCQDATQLSALLSSIDQHKRHAPRPIETALRDLEQASEQPKHVRAELGRKYLFMVLDDVSQFIALQAAGACVHTSCL